MKLPVLIEPIPIIDDFACGLGPLNSVGPCARLPFYSQQTLYEDRGRSVHVVVRKVILPREAILPCIRQMLIFLGEGAVEVHGGRLRVVH